MAKGSDLTKEVDLQLNRVRLIRVLFLVEMIVLIALMELIIIQNSPYISLPFVLFVATFLMITSTFFGIRYRFVKYCKVVENSFITMITNPKEEQE